MRQPTLTQDPLIKEQNNYIILCSQRLKKWKINKYLSPRLKKAKQMCFPIERSDSSQIKLFISGYRGLRDLFKIESVNRQCGISCQYIYIMFAHLHNGMTPRLGFKTLSLISSVPKTLQLKENTELGNFISLSLPFVAKLYTNKHIWNVALNCFWPQKAVQLRTSPTGFRSYYK